MNSRHQWCFWILIPLIIDGCASKTPLTAEIPDKPISPSTRVYFEQKCPITQIGQTREFAPLVAALVTAGIGFGVDTVVNYASNELAQAAQDQDTNINAFQTGYFYTFDSGTGGTALNKNLGCVVIISGKFSDVKPSTVQFDPFWNAHKADIQFALDDGLSGSPEFYLEGNTTVSKDGSMFRITARHIEYRNNFTSSIWSNTRDLVVTFNFSVPDSGGATKNFATSSLTLSKITAPFRTPMPMNAATATPFMAVPAETTQVKNVIASYVKLPSTTQKTKDGLELVEELEPFNLQVQIVETLKANKYLKALATTASADKSSVSSAIKNAIDPTQIAQEDATRVSAVSTVAQAAYNAENTYLSAQTAYAAAAGNNLAARQEAWNTLAAAAAALTAAIKNASSQHVEVTATGPTALPPFPSS